MPLESVQRDGKAVGADGFAEREKHGVLREVVAHPRVAEIDLDLFDPGIALDVDQPADREQVVVHVVAAAHIHGGITRAVEFAELLQSEPRGARLIAVARAETPAAVEPVSPREPVERARSVGKILRDRECLRVVGIAQAVLHVVNLVAEALQPDDVVDVLPDDTGDGASPHEAEHDDPFAFHES